MKIMNTTPDPNMAKISDSNHSQFETSNKSKIYV